MGSAAFSLTSVDAPVCRYLELDGEPGPEAERLLCDEELERAAHSASLRCRAGRGCGSR